jgi:hypothetical protein
VSAALDRSQTRGLRPAYVDSNMAPSAASLAHGRALRAWASPRSLASPSGLAFGLLAHSLTA